MLNKKDIDDLIFDVEALNLNLLVANPLSKRGFELAIEQVISLLKLKRKMSTVSMKTEESIKLGDIVWVRGALEGQPAELYEIICGIDGKLALNDDMGTALSELALKAVWKAEDCPVCHGTGATTDHHDPCTECGGSGKVGG